MLRIDPFKESQPPRGRALSHPLVGFGASIMSNNTESPQPPSLQRRPSLTLKTGQELPLRAASPLLMSPRASMSLLAMLLAALPLPMPLLADEPLVMMKAAGPPLALLSEASPLSAPLLAAMPLLFASSAARARRKGR